jgi:hypothetical protein
MEAARSTSWKPVLDVLPKFRCTDLFNNEATRRTSRCPELGMLSEF